MLDLKDKKVLVTGAGGFLGYHVAGKLVRECDLYIPSRQRLNLLDQDNIEDYLGRTQPNVIIHLAAQCGGIGINREKPGEFLYNNMMMTTNLIEAARHLNLDKFVGIGTVCSYPKHTPIPFREDSLYDGYPEETNAPYGIAKRVQLEMLRAYRTQYGFNGIYLIPVNMLGECDNFNDESSHVIPAMMKKFHRAKLQGDNHVTLWGDGSASREFLYAGDCAEAIVKATVRYNDPDPVNIGTGREITIKELAEKMREIVDYQGEIVWDVTKPNGQPRRCLDVSRARARFGFEAQTSLDEALQRTYSWAIDNDVL